MTAGRLRLLAPGGACSYCAVTIESGGTMHQLSNALIPVLADAGMQAYVDRDGDLGFRRRSAVVMVSHEGASAVQFLKLRSFLVGWQAPPAQLLEQLNEINSEIAFGAMALTNAPGFPSVAYDYSMLVDVTAPSHEAIQWTCREFTSTGDRFADELASSFGGLDLGDMMLEGGGFRPVP